MEEIPKKFSDPLFTRLFLLAKIGSFTPEELKQYNQSLESMSDYDNIINTAREEAEKLGWTVGHAEGRAEGRAETQAEIARKMLMSGMPIEQICAFTGLDVAAVEALKIEE